ncbi:MAG: PCMD domain-containing protein [Prevotella sp.]|jgi:hypothetical protein|nr:PCMD domain-containing protein [Prevotella sp.]
MRKFYSGIIVAMLLCCTALMTSCIKDEALNAEADILSVEVDGDMLIRQPVITNDEVKLYVNATDDVTKLAPKFSLTEGATIEPASGTERDFTYPQTYTVTSQDGNWKKTYKVSFVASEEMVADFHFENIKFYQFEDFETGELKDFFHVFFEFKDDGDSLILGSGNAGYMIANFTAAPEEYPTSQADGGVKGKCLKLTTVSTGALGAMVNAPIAAGNLFTGVFDTDLTNPLKSTHFGVPFRHKPISLMGYYKYKAGSTFTDEKLNVIPGRKDDFDIYAVMYEVTDDVPYLDGTNSLTSSNIVSMARLEDKKETDEWTPFTIEFKNVNGKALDEEMLATGKYNIAIVMSSSKDGGSFMGAVGSTLYVDELHLNYE